MAKRLPEIILFDLGGVLVDWDGTSPLVNLTKGNLTREQARRFWLESPWIKKYETGRCSKDDFAAGVVSELNLEISPSDFLEKFITWDRGLLPGAPELLDRLRENFVLACLSNNNELHWNSLIKDVDLTKKFDYLFISFQTGFMKPAKEAFEHVLNRTGHVAEEVLFFDDNQECVATARNIGFQAYQVLGVESVASILRSLKIGV